MKLDRREVLKLAAGAALARPLVADAEATVGAEALAAGLPAVTPAAAALPVGSFFSAPELALLDTVSEIILPADEHSPGARSAGVAGFLDAQLAQKDPKIPEWTEERKVAREHLWALDGLSREMNGKGFLEATLDQQTVVLTKAAAGERDPKTPAERAFRWAKEQTAYAYYTSKIGIHQEMEYKGNSLQVEYAGEEPR